MDKDIDSGTEARVAKAMYDALRRSNGVRSVSRGKEERSFDNVLVNIYSGGLNLRTLARAAIREYRRHDAARRALADKAP